MKSIWEHKKMSIFRNFLQWYNNKDFDPTLEAMQKLIEFSHDKKLNMFKLIQF